MELSEERQEAVERLKKLRDELDQLDSSYNLSVANINMAISNIVQDQINEIVEDLT